MSRRSAILIIIVSSVLLSASFSWAGDGDTSSIAKVTKPTEGWTLHVDAKKHVTDMPGMIVHHYCKAVSGGLTECQLYDSDKADARLIGVEVIVSKEIWNIFSEQEKALWHYHKIEIPKVDAVLPDVTAEESAKIIKGLEETYGKVYILWDPARSQPEGKPVVSILD